MILEWTWCQQTFGGYTSANLNVGLLDDHSGLNWPSTSSAVLRGEHPFAIRLRQSFDWDHTDTRLVIAAITGAESHTPSGLEKCVKCHPAAAMIDKKETEGGLTLSCMSPAL